MPNHSDNPDDPLAGLLGSARKKRKKTNTDALFGTSSERGDDAPNKGLNPLDLLALPAAQRDAINWLSRRKQATLEDIAAALKKSVDEVASVVRELRGAGYLKEALVEGQVLYRVVFGGKVSRSGRGVPADIWNAVDLENTVFLKSISLFAHLDDAALKALAADMKERHFHRNEIIAWQGEREQDVVFIKNGIVGVTRLLPGSRDEQQILAYLKQGEVIGEISMLLQGEVSSDTTATALTEVDVLAISPEKLIEYLRTDRTAALALARQMLGRLQSSNERLATNTNDAKLALVFGVGDAPGLTTLGSALALTLSHVTQGKAVYTEHPDHSRLRQVFTVEGDGPYHHQTGAFDVATVQSSGGMPIAVHTTLVMDQLVRDYPSIVISLPGTISEEVTYMMEKANQLIIIFSPQHASVEALDTLVGELRSVMHPEKTNLFVVANHTQPGLSLEGVHVRVDFEIPYFEQQVPLKDCRTAADLPEPISRVTDLLADRLGRTNQVGVYLPELPAAEVDPVQETLAFLGGIFGGATATTADGQMNEAGEVEQLNVVRTYVTMADMERHLNDVLGYAATLKQKLGLDALAVEINARLMLV